MAKGDYVGAVQSLERASVLDATNVEYRRDFLVLREKAVGQLLASAKAASGKGDAAQAEALFKQVLLVEPGNAVARVGLEGLARVQRAEADVEEAKRALARADLANAEKLLLKALERSPDHREAKQLLMSVEAQTIEQPSRAIALAEGYRKPINLEFRDASIRTVFDALSRTNGINFAFDREVRTEQRTTVFLKQTNLEDAIDVILATNQLEKKILSASSVLIYPNTPAKIKEYQDLVVKAFYLANAEAKAVAGMLKTVLRLKDVHVDERYNMLILREPTDTIRVAEKLIGLHDLEEPEVMLEVAVLEVNRSNLLNLGVQFPEQLSVTPLGGRVTSTSGASGSTSVLTINQLRRLNADLIGVSAPTATVNLQMKDGDAKLLANPSLRVRDREKARILIGDKVPVVTTTATPNGFLSESIQYLDVGLKLEAEPTIRINGEVGLKLSLEVSSLVGSVKTSNGSQAYQIGTRNYTSVLRLRDGETQVLAGLISDEDRMSANRLPLVGKLPLLGRLLSSQTDSRQKTEIVMSITPRLIRTSARKDPQHETFWSGTESMVRLRPLQLRSVDAEPRPAVRPDGSLPSPAVPALPPTVDPANTIKLEWSGPNSVRAGQVFELELRVDSPTSLRSVPLQIGYDPAYVEVVSVSEGNYFGTGGEATFGHVIDTASGRVSAAIGAASPAGARGAGTLVRLTARAIAPSDATNLSVISFSPLVPGRGPADIRLPVVHMIRVAP